MSFVITTVRPEGVAQISDTRESDLETQAVISESLRKSLIFKGRQVHFVLGWVGLASTPFGHNTTDWLFRTLIEMNALELGIDEIAGRLEAAATERFIYLSTPEKRKHTVFTMAGWEQGEPSSARSRTISLSAIRFLQTWTCGITFRPSPSRSGSLPGSAQ